MKANELKVKVCVDTKEIKKALRIMKKFKKLTDKTSKNLDEIKFRVSLLT